MAMIYQFAKFFLVGIINTLIDLGVLNLLILAFDINRGLGYTIFKSISFLVATANSFFWNKRWTFKTSQGSFKQFLIVSVIGLVINVATASLIVNYIAPGCTLASPTMWANIGAIVGSVVGLLWNFAGYKFVVFK
ncbi:MAG: GtrA family protein [bacterium]|nr:GtrA family protein [bacterium]